MKNLLLLCKVRKSRIRKEIMGKIRRVLKVAEQYENKNNRRKLSEIDTQSLLVEPILCLAGYDIYNPCIVKRASRGANTKEFDIEIYRNGNLYLAIEVKSLSSKEFNIDKIINSGIGALKKEDKYINNNGDGVGQLRAYCLNWQNKINKNTIPVLTNGREWVLFNSSFINTNGAHQKISRCMILGQAKVTDKNFDEYILKRIKHT